MLTSAMDFFSRFPEVHESGEKVMISSFGKDKDKALKETIGTLKSAYGSLYGDPTALNIVIDGALDDLDFFTPFYGVNENIFDQLFPMDSVHVATAGGLEWLSKVPDKVVKNGWNKDKAWIAGADQQVVDAYAEQAEKDLHKFLTCRKNELKIGGSLFMMMGGRPSGSKNQLGDNDSSSHKKHPFTSYMDQALQLLVNKYGLDVKKRDAFNFPVYLRSHEEVKTAIDRCGGFKIEKIVNLKIADKMNVTDPTLYGQQRAKLAEDAAGKYFEDRFGSHMNKQLFKQYAKVADTDTSLLDNDKPYFFNLIAVSVTRV